ncbi:hypothetical protein JW796_02605 [Candidatus Dojkabacteria bacterium]|nr:hypothetical protein [Candidatus Dojkabacteria bacterium]
MRKWLVPIILITMIGVLSFLALFLPKLTGSLFGSWPSKSQVYDFDSDGVVEKVIMEAGRLYVESEGVRIFSSSSEQKVNDFEIGDINNDGKDELCFGFWRVGDYGKNRPYAKARRDPLKSYHLYLYEYLKEQKVFHLLWGSSTLPEPIYDMEIVNNGQENFLKVSEGTYEDYDRDGFIRPVKTTEWVWNEWWFEEAE